MPSWKTKAVIGLGVVGLVSGATNALAPQTDDGRDSTRTTVERSVGDLSDSDQSSKDRLRDRGIDGISDENRERLRPDQPTPAHPKIRIRLP